MTPKKMKREDAIFPRSTIKRIYRTFVHTVSGNEFLVHGTVV